MYDAALLVVTMFLVSGCSVPESSTADSGTSFPSPSYSLDGGAVALVACKADRDCEASLPATNPVGCAEAKCDGASHFCSYIAADRDGDGYRDANCQIVGAKNFEAGSDCDDANPAVHPGAREICNGIDDNCNKEVDENIGPDLLTSCHVGVGLCKEVGNKTCVNGTWSGCTATGGLPVPDTQFCDNRDHDCDGVINSGCDCAEGTVDSRSCGTGDCANGRRLCGGSGGAIGKWNSCTPPVNSVPYCSDPFGTGYPTCTNYCPPASTVHP